MKIILKEGELFLIWFLGERLEIEKVVVMRCTSKALNRHTNLPKVVRHEHLAEAPVHFGERLPLDVAGHIVQTEKESVRHIIEVST